MFYFRLLCEKINKNERKSKAEILTELYKEESTDFWMALGEGNGAPPEEPIIVSVLDKIEYHITQFGSINIQ